MLYLPSSDRNGWCPLYETSKIESLLWPRPKLLSIKIDYSKYNSKIKDQFFTPDDTAKKCFEIFQKVLKKNIKMKILPLCPKVRMLLLN